MREEEMLMEEELYLRRQPNTLLMVIVLEKEIAAISMRPGDDAKPVLDKIKDTYARMAAAGSSVSQLQQCTKIISKSKAEVTFGPTSRRAKLGKKRECGHKVKVIRSDNGGEFIGADFEGELKRKGIQHQLTVPYNPQQNGVAERFNRTLQEGARTLLGRAGLPDPFWVSALRQVALVKNRVLATVGDKEWIPYVKWYGSAPAVNMLRAFGCMVVFHVPKEKRGKLEASGRWGVHLGIAKDHKGWLLWDLTTQKLTVSRDVKFLESLYYKEWKQQQQKLPSTSLIVEADERPRRDVRPPVRLTYGGRGKLNVVQAGSVVEQIEEDEIAHCYWAPIPEPKTREEALNGPNGEKWKASEDEEFGSLIENETWDLCDLPPGK
ncbi:hypothetical protein CLOM_g686 [Closterium sp. NIES-68]|nr:hypothetical protein CLOM_g686 [Closterium sp. NIES-68]